MSSAAYGGSEEPTMTRDGKDQRKNDKNDAANYSAWLAGIAAKQAAGLAAMKAVMAAASNGNKPSAPDGRSYFGTSSPPSVPDSTSEGGGGSFCGVGSSTYCLVGNGVTDIMIKLFAHSVTLKTTTSYNWVMITPPVVYGSCVPIEPGEWHGTSSTRVTASQEGGSTCCGTYHYFSYDDPDWPDDPRKPKGNKSRLSAFRMHAENLYETHKPGRLPSKVMSLGGFCDQNPFRITSWDIITEHQLDVPVYQLTGDYVKYGAFHPAVMFDITYPGSAYTLQTGSPLQGYTPLEGAFVFDMHLKKWGKMKHTYMATVDFNLLPAMNYSNLGISAGLIHADGKIHIMDDEPTEGFIRYGKIGFYRLGMTRLLETRIDMKDPGTGVVRIDSSMDGRNLSADIFKEYIFTDDVTVRMYPDIQARWFTVKISGKYDLQYMEVRGNITGRR